MYKFDDWNSTYVVISGDHCINFKKLDNGTIPLAVPKYNLECIMYTDKKLANQFAVQLWNKGWTREGTIALENYIACEEKWQKGITIDIITGHYQITCKGKAF